eukprot:m.169095 g.169095  ORF g.169095 m.169095 type:complete len:363 (-) comp9915_c1_seq19:783-1871(-)
MSRQDWSICPCLWMPLSVSNAGIVGLGVARAGLGCVVQINQARLIRLVREDHVQAAHISVAHTILVQALQVPQDTDDLCDIARYMASFDGWVLEDGRVLAVHGARDREKLRIGNSVGTMQCRLGGSPRVRREELIDEVVKDPGVDWLVGEALVLVLITKMLGVPNHGLKAARKTVKSWVLSEHDFYSRLLIVRSSLRLVVRSLRSVVRSLRLVVLAALHCVGGIVDLIGERELAEKDIRKHEATAARGRREEVAVATQLGGVGRTVCIAQNCEAQKAPVTTRMAVKTDVVAERIAGVRGQPRLLSLATHQADLDDVVDALVWDDADEVWIVARSIHGLVLEKTAHAARERRVSCRAVEPASK